MTKNKKENQAEEAFVAEEKDEGLDPATDAQDDNNADAQDDIDAETADEPGMTDEAEAGEKAEDGETRYLRLAADFQNYKRRTEKERFERYADGKKDFAEDLLPVIDNFERAIAQDITENADAKFVEGLELIYQQLLGVLEKNDVTEIDAVGKEFDPNVHHAVMQEPAEGFSNGTVSAVLQKGYQLKDKVIRPAMVKVAE
ncbi:MAG: nucleotide exchange factor GrpE [Clostridiales Family XIII bacterium]|nr:nucleotide exchange factor GrpE [Clostridiales Family XIII bacterium]